MFESFGKSSINEEKKGLKILGVSFFISFIYENLLITQENKYLRKFSYFIVKLNTDKKS